MDLILINYDSFKRCQSAKCIFSLIIELTWGLAMWQLELELDEGPADLEGTARNR